jgi:aldose 1-epimerase
MTIEKDAFGSTDEGLAVDRYTLRNASGAMARIMTQGATVTELWMPDNAGRMADVVLGFDDLASYQRQRAYFGCIVGRVAFRIANGRFLLDGQPHQLTLNDGAHHLHGGTKGFSHAVWRAEPLSTDAGPALRLTHRSPDGDQGYPGTLDVMVVYTLTEQNALRIDCTATTDKPTPINLTHHSYFNLAGADRGDILDNVLQLDADRWIPAEEPDLPSGAVASVDDTPYDFRNPTRIGARIAQTDANAKGYDLCYLHNHAEDSLPHVATLSDPKTGRCMEVLTSEPAVVLYTANYLDGTLRGKGGVLYAQYAGVCLETGRPPDAVHHPHFPSTILRPGQTYRHLCVYRFSTQ